MGKGATALKKINARVKKLAKKYPGKKRSTLQKQAGAEYRAGKLKTRKKSAAPKRKKVARKRRTVKRVAKRRVAKVGAARTTRRRKRRVSAAKPKVIIRTRTKTVRVGARRRVGAKKSLLPLLGIIAAAGVGVYLLTRKSTPNNVYIPTGNVQRDTQSQQIMAWAAAAGATANAIANLIKQINAANASGAALPDNSAVQSIINANNSNANMAGSQMLLN